MTNCIIHIGMHKTGSTSIQNSLSGFSNDDFLYADLGAANQSLAIYSLFADSPEKHQLHKVHHRSCEEVKIYSSQIEQKFDATLAVATGRTVFISGEGIGALSKTELTKLREYFNSKLECITIVSYVRSPAEFINSSFQERIKGYSKAEFNIEYAYRNYQKHFSKFDNIFGRDNVKLWKFDTKQFPNGCVVKDFCTRLGIDLPQEKIVRTNESLSKQAISLLFTYRKYGRKIEAAVMRGRESEKIGALIANMSNDKFRFSPDVIRPVLEKNRSDIEWMEQRLNEPLQEELGEHQPGDIRNESDLLTPDPELIEKLLGFLSDDAPTGIKGKTPEEVALLVDALRRKVNKKKMLDKLETKMSKMFKPLEQIRTFWMGFNKMKVKETGKLK